MGKYVSTPINQKIGVKNIKNKYFSAGFPFRGYIVMLLSDDEVGIYKQYGDDCHINQSTGELVSPQ